MVGGAPPWPVPWLGSRRPGPPWRYSTCGIPTVAGSTSTRKIRSRHPGTAFLMLTWFSGGEVVNHASWRPPDFVHKQIQTNGLVTSFGPRSRGTPLRR